MATIGRFMAQTNAVLIIPGVHLEGPFISLQEKGAHTSQYITGFEHGFDDLLTTYGSLNMVSILTLAPELGSALDIIQALVSKGITVSLGEPKC